MSGASFDGTHAPASVVAALSATRPWVRFIGIVGFVVSALLLLGGGGMMFVAKAGTVGMPVMAVGAIYVASSVLYGFVSYRMLVYGRAIQVATSFGSSEAVALALQQNRSLWSAFGIVFLIALAVNLGIAIPGIVMPNFRQAVERAKLKRTAADMRLIGEAMERYARDHHEYPQVETMADLSAALVPSYAEVIPEVDGWERDLAIDTNCLGGPCWDYRLVSFGSDGAPQFERDVLFALGQPNARENPDRDGKRPPFEEGNDLIVGGGRFLRAPDGMTGRLSIDE